ncbi:MAG: hypothetical protein ACE5KE_07110 [Methanosarcinales archaeon]
MAEISEQSAREKNIRYGRPSTLRFINPRSARV